MSKKATNDATTTETIAAQLLEEIEQLESILADFDPRDAREVRRLANNARYAHELVVPVIDAVTNAALLKDRGMFDVASGLDALKRRDLLGPLALRLARLADRITFDNNRRLSAAGREALAVYHWSKRMARDPDGAELRPFVKRMERAVKRSSNRRKKPARATRRRKASSTPPDE